MDSYNYVMIVHFSYELPTVLFSNIRIGEITRLSLPAYRFSFRNLAGNCVFNFPRSREGVMIGDRRRDLTHALKVCRLKFVDALGEFQAKKKN